MKLVLLASLGVLATANQPVPPPNKWMLFDGFMKRYNKQYATEFEKGKRFRIFSENIDKIYASNAQNKTYTLGVNANADKTFEEWRAAYLTGFRPPLTATKNKARFSAPKGFSEPDSVDWVEKGGVSPVKNQGTCGSCWTFSATGALEGAMFVAGRKLVDLSQQELVDCDTGMLGGHGCKGGNPAQAFGWVKSNGLCGEDSYPYVCMNMTANS